jgi:hypothetical protein
MKKYLYILSFLTLLVTGGCKKFIDVNQDPNNPTDVQESLLLAPLEVNISHVVSAGTAPIYANHWMQNIALNQPVPNTGTYLMVNVEADGDWSNLFATCLNNLRILNTKAEANESSNYAAIAKVLTAYCLGTATSLWGDIPYSEALKGADNFLPVYDKQEDIYTAIQQMLDAAITDIAANSPVLPAGDDYYYGGDMEKWKKLAYTLKARYYMHLTDAPGHTPAEQAGLALTALQNGMSSNDDDMKLAYTGAPGQENPWYLLFLPVSTVVLSSAAVDTLIERNDPRLPKLVTPALQTGEYYGREIGQVDLGSLEEYSLGGPAIADAASPNYMVTYNEALFLEAEATLYASGAAAAEPIYQQAITSNMEKLGVAATDIQTYLGTRGTIDAESALRMIMEEKKIANFLNIENFTDWRRTGFPVLTPVPNSTGGIPRRYLYPQIEISTNAQPQQSAKLTDKLWFDQ